MESDLFETLFALSRDIMCVASADGYFKRVNPAFCRALGFSEGELLATPIMDFILPVDRQTTQIEIARQLQGGTTVDFENRYRCKDGAIRLLSWRAVAHNSRQLLVATARDITDARAGEEQLSKLELAVEQTSHSVVITDLDARIEYVNQAFSKISGYSAEEALGQNPRILKSGQTPASTFSEMWHALWHGETWHGEFVNRRKNGELYVESVRISPVRQSNGRITHYLAIKEDITEHKRALEAIRQSKMLLQRVIDSIQDWIFVKDNQHRYVLVNDSFARAFGHTPDNMVGHTDSDILAPKMVLEDPGLGIHRLHHKDDLALSGQSIHYPADKLIFANGDIRIFDRFKGPLYDASHKVYGILGNCRDITERVNAEQEQRALEIQLRQAQKMELIGHLTSGIAHDFNNILAAIIGYAELIQIAPAKANEYVEQILQAGIRARELVSQLLIFGHKKEVANEAIMVAPIVKEVSKLLRSTLPTSISIKTSIANRLPKVLISPTRLHQVLMNLGVNARDAVTGMGTLEIMAEPIVLDAVKTCSSCHQTFSGRHAMISVAGTGSGISPENLQKIFDPFFTTKTVGQGGGLGLSVLHGIVHSANGHIEVLTTVGEGTEFRIYLPAHSEGSSRRVQVIQKKADTVQTSGKVMVVDDEESIVGFMTSLLENIGCKVIGLTSSSEALRLFEENPYCIDMVVTDQTMPEITGAQLAKAMLIRRPDIPIVMYTGYSNEIDENKARQIGIRRFLIKPVPQKVLVDIVAECMRAAKTG